MGVTITATNSKYRFDMGCGGFFNLRKNIAIALDPDFGQNYANLAKCHLPQHYKEHDHIANCLIKRKGLDKEYADVIDFLYQPDDEDGKISHKTCKKIYELLETVNLKGKGFRYAAYMHNDYDEFKAFLLECYSYRRCMRWM